MHLCINALKSEMGTYFVQLSWDGCIYFETELETAWLIVVQQRTHIQTDVITENSKTFFQMQVILSLSAPNSCLRLKPLADTAAKSLVRPLTRSSSLQSRNLPERSFCKMQNFTELMHPEQGNYSLRRPPKLIIPQIFIEQRWATVYRFTCNLICIRQKAYKTRA